MESAIETTMVMGIMIITTKERKVGKKVGTDCTNSLIVIGQQTAALFIFIILQHIVDIAA